MGKRNSYNDDCEIDPTVGDELHGTVKTNRHNGVAHTQQQRQSVSLNLLHTWSSTAAGKRRPMAHLVGLASIALLS